MPLTLPADLFEASLFQRDGGDTGAALIRALAPETWQTYQELLEASGNGAAAAGGRPRPEHSLRETVMLAWARASRASATARAEALARDQECDQRVSAAMEQVRAELAEELRIRVGGDGERGIPAEASKRVPLPTRSLATMRATGRRLKSALTFRRRRRTEGFGITAPRDMTG